MKGRKLRRRMRRRRQPSHPPRRGPAGQTSTGEKEKPVMIGGAHDPAEKTADRAAAQALAGGPVTVAGTGTTGTGTVQRKCAECDKEDEAKRAPGAGPTVASGGSSASAGPAASTAIRSMGSGKPLDSTSRAFFEPRFDRDFSGVRVHDGPEADRAARAIDARAFAWGSDIAFASGEREKGGNELMAHELAHVATEGGDNARREVRRATLATSDGPDDYKSVPIWHYREVNRALALVQRAIRGEKCRNYFRDKCTNGTLDSAQNAVDNAIVYYLPDHTGRFGLSDLPNIIAYNRYAYDVGRWEIAATLLHEMFHTCDTTIDNMDEILAEGSNEACGFYSPWILDASPLEVTVGDTVDVSGFGLGPVQDADHYLELGGDKITSYNSWAQTTDSDIAASFDIPASAGPSFISHDLDLVAVNNGVRSNVKTVEVSRF